MHSVLPSTSRDDSGPAVLESALRAIVADDHPAARSGLARALEHAGVRVVGVAHDGAHALALARSEDPDVAVVDLRMPGLSGLDVARTLREQGARTRVLIVSAYEEPELVSGALSAGAHGFFSKSSPGAAIADATIRCSRGALVAPPWFDPGEAAPESGEAARPGLLRAS